MSHPTLRKGDKGSDVKELQQLLNRSGANLLVDGDFGAKTYEAVRYFQETHQGPDRKFLKVDGVVGPNTWWALGNPEGTPQRSFLPGEIPNDLVDYREQFLTIPLHEWELGVKEVPGGSNWSTEPEGGIAKYNDYEYDPQAWCMRFAKWCFRQAASLGILTAHQADLVRKLGDSGSCSRTWKKALELNAEGILLAYPNDGKYIPIPGDMAIMDGHVTLVLRVRVHEDGSFDVNTVEGNSGNRVKVGFRKGDVFVGFVNYFGDGHDDRAHKFEYGTFSAEDTSRLSTR